VRVWDLTTGTHTRTLTGHTDWVWAVAVAELVAAAVEVAAVSSPGVGAARTPSASGG